MTSDSEARYEMLIRRIEKQYARRTQFGIHLAALLLTTASVWFVWLKTIQPPRIGLIDNTIFILTIAWFITLVLHGVYLLVTGARERAIHRAIIDARASTFALEWDDKPKNDRRMRLTEDGELEVISDDDSIRTKKSKRS